MALEEGVVVPVVLWVNRYLSPTLPLTERHPGHLLRYGSLNCIRYTPTLHSEAHSVT